MIIDASAMLAFLFREPGHERVAHGLGSSPCMSAVNLSEVIGRFVRDGHDPAEVLSRLQATALEIAPFQAEDAALTAALEPATRAHGLSFADRACLALGLARNGPVLTADRAWLDLEIGVDVVPIR